MSRKLLLSGVRVGKLKPVQPPPSTRPPDVRRTSIPVILTDGSRLLRHRSLHRSRIRHRRRSLDTIFEFIWNRVSREEYLNNSWWHYRSILLHCVMNDHLSTRLRPTGSTALSWHNLILYICMCIYIYIYIPVFQRLDQCPLGLAQFLYWLFPVFVNPSAARCNAIEWEVSPDFSVFLLCNPVWGQEVHGCLKIAMTFCNVIWHELKVE